MNTEMHFEAVIVRNRRPLSSEYGDTLGGCDWASLEMHLEAMIVGNWRP